MPRPSSTPPPQAPDPGGPTQGAADLHNRADVERVLELIVGALTIRAYPKASVFAVRLALEEAVSNAFHHGHRSMPEGTPVRLEYRIEPTRVALAVEDRGPGFNPASVPDPTLDQNLESPSGRGLMLMRAYMTRVEFNSRGNKVTMVYDRPAIRNGAARTAVPGPSA